MKTTSSERCRNRVQVARHARASPRSEAAHIVPIVVTKQSIHRNKQRRTGQQVLGPPSLHRYRPSRCSRQRETAAAPQGDRVRAWRPPSPCLRHRQVRLRHRRSSDPGPCPNHQARRICCRSCSYPRPSERRRRTRRRPLLLQRHWRTCRRYRQDHGCRPPPRMQRWRPEHCSPIHSQAPHLPLSRSIRR